MKRALKIISIVLLIAIGSLATFFIILFTGGFGKIPTKKDLTNISNETSSLVYSEDKHLIGAYFTENRTNVPYDSLPKHLVNALIATEDARFYEHEGVDSRALVRVLLKTILLQNKRAGGGSTLSQQLAKNLFSRKDYGRFSILVNKLKEIILANRLEEIYSKEQIIELYFNTVPFGENVYGIQVASRRFFSVSVSQLKIEQSAVLVGMLKANTAYNPRLHPKRSIERRSVVLLQMNKYNYLTKKELDSISKIDLNLNYSNISADKVAPYFLPQVKSELTTILKKIEKESGESYNPETDGLKIITTLNYNLQKAGVKAMEKHLSKMQVRLDKQYKSGRSKSKIIQLANKIARKEKLDISKSTSKKRDVFLWNKSEELKETSLLDSLVHTLKQLQAGILALNPKTGAIKTWIGGIDHNYYPYDQVLAKRQVASTFKPFLYAQALQNGRSPCDYLSNKPIVLNDYDDWSPQNYDGESGGSYSLAAALANSKNLPTVHLYFETSQDSLTMLWQKLGFSSNLEPGPSVILGTNSESMLDLAKAYSVFANNGYQVEEYAIQEIYNKSNELIYKKENSPKTKVLAAEVTSQVNSILEKAINEGTGTSFRSSYGIRIPMAGKTGTAQNYSDAWFVNYNSNLVMVSRVGTSYPNISFNNGAYGSGGRLALPLAAITFQEACKDRKFKSEMLKSGLNSVELDDCLDFKEADFIDNLFDVFKKKETNLEQQRKKAKRKKKVKGFFKNLFGN